MLIVALVLAVIGLASLVAAVVTGNELIAWVCIAASVLGVILLIIDAIKEKQARDVVPVEADADGAASAPPATVDSTYRNFDAEYPEDVAAASTEAIVDESVLAESDIDEVRQADSDEPAAEVDAEPDVVAIGDDAEADVDSTELVHDLAADESDTAIECLTETTVDEVKGA